MQVHCKFLVPEMGHAKRRMGAHWSIWIRTAPHGHARRRMDIHETELERTSKDDTGRHWTKMSQKLIEIHWVHTDTNWNAWARTLAHGLDETPSLNSSEQETFEDNSRQRDEDPMFNKCFIIYVVDKYIFW